MLLYGMSIPGVAVCLSKYPSTYDNFYLLYSGEQKNFSGRLQSTNSSMTSSNYTTRIPHAEETHTIAPAINKNNQRKVYPASRLIHRPFLAALTSAYSAGLIPFFLHRVVSASVILLMSYSLARHSPLPLLPLHELPSVCVCSDLLSDRGGQVRRRAGVLGELVQRDAARDSRGVRAARAALCAGLEEAGERVAALGAGGCGGGRGGRGVEAGYEDSEGVWDELVGEGA